MERRIFYHDTDAGGVVYYGNYLKFLEEARTEFLESKGLNIKELHNQGFMYAVRNCNVSYRAPARYGDLITCDAKITEITAARIFFEQKIYNKETGQLLVEAEVVLVSLTKEFKPTVVPDDVKERMLG